MSDRIDTPKYEAVLAAIVQSGGAGAGSGSIPNRTAAFRRGGIWRRPSGEGTDTAHPFHLDLAANDPVIPTSAAAWPRKGYASVLEIGCGTGELPEAVTPRWASCIGLNAIPRGRPDQDGLFGDLPDGAYDLIVLSEVLHGLAHREVGEIASQIDRRWPDADVAVFTRFEPTKHGLGGLGSLAAYANSTLRTRRPMDSDDDHRVDVFLPLAQVSRGSVEP